MQPDGRVNDERRALRVDIHSVLIDRLTTNHWAPGDHVSIDGVARELKVSPTPVREAMVALERTGLVKYRARRGYIVAPPLDHDQVRQLIDARLIVERAALSRAFRRGWDQLVDDLRAAHTAHTEAAGLVREDALLVYGRLRDYFEADVQFHQAFFRSAQNEFLNTMHESLGAHAHRMRQTWARGRDHVDLDETLLEHRQILSRVEEHNHDGALAALEEHLVNVQRRFIG